MTRTMNVFLILGGLLLLRNQSADGFTAPLSPAHLQQRTSCARCSPPSTTSRRSSHQLYAYDNKGRDSGGGGGGWSIKNDFKTFLNQCTIQSFMFLLLQLRDVETARWVEEFTRPTVTAARRADGGDDGDANNNYDDTAPGKFVQEKEQNPRKGATLLRYHGLAALNQTLFPTWEDFFLTLIDQPMETYLVTSIMTHVPDYELEIKPASLCSRMISVREQISKEWIRDLDVISATAGQIIDSYWEKLKESATADRTKDGNDSVRPERQNLLFLEWMPFYGDDAKPSPLRKGNFDLLCLLTLQEAIHRVLNNNNNNNEEHRNDGGAAAVATNAYLTTFYEDRLESHFTGNQRYGRADDFLEDLIATAPRLITVNKNRGASTTALIDPIGIAEMILQERAAVANEWKEAARISPAEHLEVRRMMLDKMMMESVQQQPLAGKQEAAAAAEFVNTEEDFA